MKKVKLIKTILLLSMLSLFLLTPRKPSFASSKTFTPLYQYYGAKIKRGNYYVYRGGTRWIGFSKKKNPSESEQFVLPARDGGTANDAVIYSYCDKYDPGNVVKSHTIYKTVMKTNTTKKLADITDKKNPDNDSLDGFKFATAYGNTLYYNASQKITGGQYDYVRTYKLMGLNCKNKKKKLIRKNFEILGSTNKYIFGRSTKPLYYVFNLKKNKFSKMSGAPASDFATAAAYRDTVYGAFFSKKVDDGYQKIVLMKFNGSKKKLEKIKTLTCSGDDFLDGYIEENTFKYTKNLNDFYKYNFTTKKTTEITAREYDYDLDPDYGDDE